MKNHNPSVGEANILKKCDSVTSLRATLQPESDNDSKNNNNMAYNMQIRTTKQRNFSEK